MRGYWTALIATVLVINGLLGPPLDFLPGRRNFPFLPGSYQLAGIYAVIFLGLLVHPVIRGFRPAQRAWVGVLIGSLPIPTGFLIMVIAHWL